MKRALGGNLVFIWIFIVLVTGIALIGGIDSGIATLKYTVPVGLMGTIIYFIPFNEKVKGTILASIPAVFALILSVIQGGEVKMFYIYILSLVMQALYLNRNLMIGYGSVMCIGLTIIYFISPTLLVGSNTQMVEFIIPMGALVITFFVLVLLTSIEKEKTLVSDTEIDDKQEILKKLKVVLKEVDFATNNLKDKFNNCDDKIKIGRKGTQNITSSMKELVISSAAATATVSNISKSATLSRENFGQIYEIASYINQYLKNAMDDISNSQASLANLRQEIDKMGQIARGNHEIIQQFSKEAEDVESLVDKIAYISNQTNLLALDASIEAVRAGEDGEKFASVAEKIRILSEESGELLKGIRNITNERVKPIKVEKKEGDGINLLKEKLKGTKNSLNLAGEQIQEKLELVNTIKNEFNIIDNDIHNITVVIDENAVRFEEVLVRMEEQADIINEASGVMGEIITISDNLNKLVKFTQG